jgi:hypothetical protein
MVALIVIARSEATKQSQRLLRLRLDAPRNDARGNVG